MPSCVEHAISNIKSGTDDGRILITPSKRGGGGGGVLGCLFCCCCFHAQIQKVLSFFLFLV